MFNLTVCLTPPAIAAADRCTCLVEGLKLTIWALQVEVDHVPCVQEGQAARDVQRDGFAEARLPLAIGATLPVSSTCQLLEQLASCCQVAKAAGSTRQMAR